MTSEFDKDTLASWTRRYRRVYPNQYTNPRAFYINERLVADILKAVNSSGNKGGLRMYWGLDEDGRPHMIVVAVNRDGKDVIEPKGKVQPAAALLAGETYDKCPSNCDGTSRLAR